MNDNLKNDKTRLVFSDLKLARQLFGEYNSNLKKIEELVDVSIHVRGNIVFIQGDGIAENLAKNILKQLYNLLKEGYPIYPNDIDYAVRILSEDDRINIKDIFLDSVYITSGTRPVIPKSPAQKEYIDAIRSSDMVFGIGPAGTGKTYLAMAMAVEAFSKTLVDRIVLTRPVVEAGEALGFLPGDIAKKVDPYLRPFYDALYDLIGFEKVSELMEQDIIEVAPIAFMRGRTLNNSFVILDEAQNTTSEQMKMFLTRIGFGSKMVITGDITQSDLPIEKTCGLIEAKNILQDIGEINFILFSKKDVVRHGLVRRIIKAYEEVEWKRLELARKLLERELEIDQRYQNLFKKHKDSLGNRPHFEKHSKVKEGVVYVLTNDSMPGLVKIGFTRGNSTDRAEQISEQHDLKSPFLVKGDVPTIGPYIIEQLVHIELADLRESGEFFKIDADEALTMVRKYADKPPE